MSNERSANYYYAVSDIIILQCKLEELKNHRKDKGKVSRDCDVPWKMGGWTF